MENQLREFTTTDWYGFAGAECAPDGRLPHVAYLPQHSVVADSRGVEVTAYSEDGYLWVYAWPPSRCGLDVTLDLTLAVARGLDWTRLTPEYLEACGFIRTI
jgi:hypothetical protein